MLGIWSSFEELEDSISLRELYVLLEAGRKRLYDDRVFNAKIHGIQIDKPKQETGSGNSLLDAVRERLGKNKEAPVNKDITSLRGKKARDMGFGIGFGLDYEVIDANGVSVVQ